LIIGSFNSSGGILELTPNVSEDRKGISYGKSERTAGGAEVLSRESAVIRRRAITRCNGRKRGRIREMAIMF